MFPLHTVSKSLTPLLGMTPDELQHVVNTLGMPRYVAKQLTEWLYQHRVRSIDEMTNLSKTNRQRLQEQYCVGCAEPIQAQRSVDGTVKYLFQAEGGSIESVYIPDGERATLCVSSQVGCRMGCVFCMTGQGGFHGQLTATEILNQIYALPEGEDLTNVVFMGMGEPMDNIDAVLRALDVLTAEWGFAWSPRRITVSTIGVRRGLVRFLNESRCHLAVSLHHPVSSERIALMPAEKAFPVQGMVDLLRQYDWTGGRRLSFEYTCFAGINDIPESLKELTRLLNGLNCRINLIRFHAIPNSPLKGTDERTMLAMRDYLTAAGIFTTIRASRGEDIFAACGMLAGESAKV